LAAFFTTLLIDFLTTFFEGSRFAAGFFAGATVLAADLFGTAFLTAFFVVLTADLVVLLVDFAALPIVRLIVFVVDLAMVTPLREAPKLS
jgi:hypothetical protein